MVSKWRAAIGATTVGEKIVGALLVLWIIAVGWLAASSALESYGHLGLLDLQVYRMGGQAVLDRSPVYDALYPHDQLPFTYSPFAAIAFVPLAAIGWSASAIAMTIASLSSGIRACIILSRHLRPRFTHAPLLWLLALVCLFFTLWPVRSTLEYGQINLIVFWLVVEDLLGIGANKRWSGVLLGLASGVKLTPLAFVGMLWFAKQYRRLAVVAASAGATVAIGFVVMPSGAWQYWTQSLWDTSRVGASDFVANQSVLGVITRVQASASSVWWFLGATAVFVASSWLGGALWRMNLRVEAATAAAVGGLLISPISWAHHWVWLIPMAMVLLVPAPFETSYLRRLRVLLLIIGAAVASIRPQTLVTSGAMPWSSPTITDWIVGDGFVLLGLAYLAFLAAVYRGSALGLGQSGRFGDEGAADHVIAELVAAGSGRKRRELAASDEGDPGEAECGLEVDPFEAFCDHLASAIGRAPADLGDCSQPLSSDDWDELELADLFMALEELNPYFELPEGLAPEDASLHDLYFFCSTMGPEHVRESNSP